MLTDEKKLLEFIENHTIESNEYNWEVLLFIRYSRLDEFSRIVWENYFDEEWETITMKYWYVCIDIKPICEYLDIEIDNIIRVLNKFR